jgi:hypothetical protein
MQTFAPAPSTWVAPRGSSLRGVGGSGLSANRVSVVPTTYSPHLSDVRSDAGIELRPAARNLGSRPARGQRRCRGTQELSLLIGLWVSECRSVPETKRALHARQFPPTERLIAQGVGVRGLAHLGVLITSLTTW